MGMLECPLCCREKFCSRAELQKHLQQVAVRLNSLACTVCKENFLTLQDVIEHLRYECMDAEGKKIARDNHITYIDCGAFCKPVVIEQVCDIEKKIAKYVKVNRKRMRPSKNNNQMDQFVEPCNTSINNDEVSIEETPSYTVLASKDGEICTIEDVNVSETQIEMISLPPHLVEVTIEHQEMDITSPPSPQEYHFESESTKEVVVDQTSVIEAKKYQKTKTQKQAQLPAIPLVFYPKPEGQRVKITETPEAGSKEVVCEEEEMFVGTEEEALAANVDPTQIIYKCSQCNDLFPLKAEYNQHCCGYRCNVCKLILKSAKILKKHKQTHEREEVEQILSKIKITGTAQFYCDKCNDKFSCDLKEVHERIHDENLPVFKCDKCEHIYVSGRGLVMHVKEVHTQGKHVCGVCGLKCTSIPNLRNHMCTHTGQKPFKCKFCEKTFNRSGDRNKHERVHTGEKPNVCDLCGKSFRVKCSLSLHMRTHTNERPYTCNLCNKKFKSFSSLSFHTKSHGEDRPYKCPFCGKGFKTLNSLYSHKNSHKKPFKCEVCDRAFSVRHAMVKHQARMHHSREGRDKFDCVVCGSSYGRAWSLEMHLKTHGKLGDNTGITVLKKMVAMGSSVGTDEADQAFGIVEKRPPRIRKKKHTLDL